MKMSIKACILRCFVARSGQNFVFLREMKPQPFKQRRYYPLGIPKENAQDPPGIQDPQIIDVHEIVKQKVPII